MTKSPLRVICDAGPIIHLDELDCLDLLNDFKEIILPATVTKEIKRMIEGRPQLPQRKQGGGYIMILDKPPKQKTQKTSGLTLYNYRLKIIPKEFNREGLKNYVI